MAGHARAVIRPVNEEKRIRIGNHKKTWLNCPHKVGDWVLFFRAADHDICDIDAVEGGWNFEDEKLWGDGVVTNISQCDGVMKIDSGDYWTHVNPTGDGCFPTVTSSGWPSLGSDSITIFE